GITGRSMENIMRVSTELGYMKVPEGVLVSMDKIKSVPKNKTVIITTGSQGEELSALHRMAFSDHRQVEITPNDLIIISATPIPGNEKLVNKVINELTKHGAKVVYEKMYDVHVSGHACQEEQKLMLSLVKPKFFVPVHGEQKHLRKHAETAVSLGMKKENIVVADLGRVIELTAKSVKCKETVEAGRLLIDGLGVGDVGSVVLRDRKHLAEDGIFVVVMCLDSATGEMLSGPEVISRGFVYVKGSEELMDETREIVWDIVEDTPIRSQRDWNTMKTRVRDSVSRLLYERTGRSPMILPIIMEI
ncbi:MAG: ribonuclease J, partial [Clostridia bacterium]|nr:ribonuclease J [Clostridia bacterium]